MLTIHFQGNPNVGIVANTPDGGAQAEWWSNSANNTDATLTRAFDFTALAGKPVTLNFRAWYNLEQDFDYTYVEASTDGGVNWTPLHATTSSTSNPNGANYGNGITGVSGVSGQTDCPTAPSWVSESVDLSAYAGKQILLRFETISDDAVHCPGMTLDAIAIPQLSFTDDASTDNGWQAQGWIRSNNVLPEKFIVQAVVYPTAGEQPQITQIPVDAATGAGTFTLPELGGAVSHVTLVVSALAPTTIVPAQYQLIANVS
jgi:hypothetical protein